MACLGASFFANELFTWGVGVAEIVFSFLQVSRKQAPFAFAVCSILAVLTMAYYIIDNANRATQSHALLICAFAISQFVTMMQYIGVLLKTFEKFELQSWRPATEVQARKRHININFLVRLVLGRPRVCLGDKPGLSLGQTQVFSLFYTVEAGLSLGQTQFVPGTNPWAEGWYKKFMC